MQERKSVVDRFLEKCTVNADRGIMVEGEWSPCLEWTRGRVDKDGYGQFRIGSRIWQAHRAFYFLLYGEAPPAGMVLDHLCVNPRCVLHTEPVTQRENVRRGASPVGRKMRQVEKGGTFA